MSLRRRLALLSAAAVAVTVVLASAIVYFLVRDSLRDQVDEDLLAQADRGSMVVGALGPGRPEIARLTPGAVAERRRDFTLPAPPPGDPVPVGQVIEPDGRVVTVSSGPELPVDDEVRSLAAAGGEDRFEDVDADGQELRVLTRALPEGGALQVARPLEDTEDTLSNLLVILFLVSAGGIAAAAALGPVVARTALAPAGEVSEAAEDVARTRDLTKRIEVRGDDELGRLSASFNEMMAALERSEASQRRLVADASHELRTPLATLRTNIETLGRSDAELRGEQREQLVADITGELEALTELVADVVELAREPGRETLVLQDVALDELARDAVERAQRRSRGLRFTTRIEPSLVSGDPQRLGRAISNMLDNAAKWSPAGGEVEVDVGAGRVTVRDHGPGFAPDDLAKVFDRFWRADEARGKQGSGLGLAIVQRVAEEHGGAAEASNAEDGGAVVAIELPPLDPQAAS